VRWTLYWLLIPNLVVILMWPIGGPPMQAALFIYGPLALLASQIPWMFGRTIGVALLTLWVVTTYLSSMFAIPALNYRMFLQFLMDVRPLRAPEYVVAGLIILAALIVAIRKAPSVPRFSSAAHYLMALLAILVFISLDTAVTASTSNGYRRYPPANLRFDSAVQQVRLGPNLQRRHHVLLVVVESLGLPIAPDEKRLFAGAWDRPGWRERYYIRHGSTPYFGSTTNGELRELCGRWSDYTRFEFESAHCLPERFRAAGYTTSAIHAFSSSMFDRGEWYPKLTFHKSEFADDLFRDGAGHCEGVFPGACDRDVPEIIGKRLKDTTSPQFVYWLTLNSHLPIMVDETDIASVGCRLGSEEWRTNFPRVCRLFQKHQELADAIDRMIMAPGFPPTDILIVGDHKPPFFDRGNRSHFDPSHVPWIFLKARER
jgi:hypothetical protein